MSESGTYGELLVTSLLVLVVVCVLAFVVVKLARRFLAGPRGQPGVMDVIARVALEPRRSLYVVEVGGKTLLVGTSEMGLSVLTELDPDKVRVAAAPTRVGFVEMVQAAIERRRARKGGSA